MAWLRQLPLLSTVEVTHGDASTRLEWVVDSNERFVPAMRDATFGYVLHPVDLAINKVMAAAGGHEVRDLGDLMMIHDTMLPLGAVILARGGQVARIHPRGVGRRNQAERVLPGSRVARRVDRGTPGPARYLGAVPGGP